MVSFAAGKWGRRVRIGAVSFDADGTLWDFEAVMRHALQIVLGELRGRWPGSATAALSVEKLIAVRDTVAERSESVGARLEDIRREAFVETLEQIDGADVAAADEINELYLHHRFADVEVFDDVTACLDELAGRYPLGLLSNGNSYPDLCGLDSRFSFTVFAHDHGVAKPEPRLFRIAAKAVGCPIDELVHVGDGSADIEGAAAAGCRCVLIDRLGRRPAYASLADEVISDLRQLPEILDALGQSRP